MDEIDKTRRQFLVAAASTLGVISIAGLSIPFVKSWSPSEKAKAEGAPVQVDLSGLQPGELKIVEWRGKPVWIIRRNPEMLRQLEINQEKLRDPASQVDQQPQQAQNIYRSVKPEYLILIGICTHLGCSPKYRPTLGELGPDWPGGFYCPCHGSIFDLSGRVFKGVPAPINLEVPPHHYLGEQTVVIGDSE